MAPGSDLDRLGHRAAPAEGGASVRASLRLPPAAVWWISHVSAKRPDIFRGKVTGAVAQRVRWPAMLLALSNITAAPVNVTTSLPSVCCNGASQSVVGVPCQVTVRVTGRVDQGVIVDVTSHRSVTQHRKPLFAENSETEPESPALAAARGLPANLEHLASGTGRANGAHGLSHLRVAPRRRVRSNRRGVFADRVHRPGSRPRLAKREPRRCQRALPRLQPTGSAPPSPRWRYSQILVAL